MVDQLFCLNEDLVGSILQACLGGVAKDFNVIHLSGWMFSFTVSYKDVGFMIYKLKSFTCKSFDAFFHLWVEEDLTGAEILISGGLNKNRNGPQLVLSLRRVLLMLFALLSAPKRSVFVCLNYPDNYNLNYRDFTSDAKKFVGVKPPDPKAAAPKNHRHGRSRRVRRWVPKAAVTKPASSQEKRLVDLNGAPSQELSSGNSNSKSPVSTPPWPNPSIGPAQSPLKDC